MPRTRTPATDSGASPRATRVENVVRKSAAETTNTPEAMSQSARPTSHPSRSASSGAVGLVSPLRGDDVFAGATVDLCRSARLDFFFLGTAPN